MGIKRIVDTGFWTDDKILDTFSPEDKLFFLYLMTNPHTTQLGIYQLNLKYISLELGYTVDTCKILIDRFQNKYGMIMYSYDTKEIAIKNYLKYSIVKGGKPVEDLLEKEIKQVKDKRLLTYVYDNLIDYENLNATVVKILSSLNKNEIKNDNDNDNDVSYNESSNESYNESCKEIIDYLNQKVGTKFKHTTAETKKHINGRIDDGYTLDDFKTVIDKKYAEWYGTEMQQYLRPSTLFSPTNFENYLNAVIIPKKPKQQNVRNVGPVPDWFKNEKEEQYEKLSAEEAAKVQAEINRMLGRE